jgi:chromosome partitioning protein
MTTTITLSNEKGGVAKTTSALSVGAALAEMGQRVLLVDLDPQANLTLALGYEPGEAQRTSADVLLDMVPVLSARRSTDVTNLDLVPGASRIESAEQFLPVRSDYTTVLRRALRVVPSLPYEYVVIDCPPALGAITINALTAADLLVIPTQPEYFSAYALRNMMSLIRRVRQDGNAELAYRVLVTMLDRRNRSHRNIYEQLRGTFGAGVLTTVIEIDTKLRESPIAGLPITQYKSGTRGSVQYRVLAQELMQYASQTANRQPA